MTRSPLERLIERGNAVALALSAGLLAVMVGIVTLNVVARYLLHTSLTWSAELARYCVVWSAMLAAAVLVSRREHLAVDVLERRLSPAGNRWLTVLEAVMTLTFTAVLCVSGVLLVAGAAGQAASSIEVLPVSVVYAVMPVSAVLMFAGAAVILLRAADGRGQGR